MPSPDHRYVGTATLVRFMLRRDRIRLPAWVGGIGLFWVYFTRLVPQVYPDLDAVAGLVEGAMGRLYTGPGHGFDDLTFGRFLIGGYGLYIILLSALSSLLLVVRHTRLEEQAGRVELVRANVVGRHAPLTAALVVAAVNNVALTMLIWLVTVTSPHMEPGGSVLFAVGVGLTGLVFAAVAAVSAQATAFSRTAAGLAGGVLGAAFIIRALGDMAAQGGTLLSWFSPLAWPQQTAPLVFDRWWPLAFSVATIAATVAVAYRLADSRDVGASLLATRPGPEAARPWLGSPLGLAWRLQRSGIIGWTASLTLTGALFGAWTEIISRDFRDLPDTILDLLGGVDNLVAGYLALMALFMALLVGVFVALAVQSLRSEETAGRAEPVLATPVSRVAWIGSWVTVTAGAAVAMLGLTGLGTGIGAVAVTGDWSLLADATAAHLVFAPAVLVVQAFALFLFGRAPRWIPVALGLVAYGLLAGVFGEVMDLPDWTAALSPFEHVTQVPLESVGWGALVAMVGLAGALALGGTLAFTRRDLHSA